jgi:hypothetical protein
MVKLTVVAATGLSTALVRIHVVGRNEVVSGEKNSAVSCCSQIAGLRGVFWLFLIKEGRDGGGVK